MKKILYAITGHGFGHATRALVVAQQLKQHYPGLELTLSSAVDPAAIRRFIPDFSQQCRLRQQDYEPGLIQKTCFEVDPKASIASYLSLSRELPDRIDAESALLERGGFEAVISDVAAIPLEAAARLGVPSVVIGNFTWDWILEPFIKDHPQLGSYYRQLQKDYASAQKYFRLPFHAPEHPFRQCEGAPLIGRRALSSRNEILSRLGIADDRKRKLVLVAVGGWGSEGLGDILVKSCSDCRFLVIGDLPIRTECAELIRLPFSLGSGLTFPDLVRIADIGVVKPGYGTCSEFVLNNAGMVGIERRHMREAEVLNRSIADYIPYSHLKLEDFFAGNWQDALEAVKDQPVPEFPYQTSEISDMIESITDALKL